MRQHIGIFRIHVLCLDESSFSAITALNACDIVPVSRTDLECFDPELAAARGNRSLIEYYFTCTAAFCRYLFLKNDDIDALTYLDADLYFFSDISPLIEEIGDKSIAIIPHRFSDSHYRWRESGLFNVGWITWRRTETGLACLEDYRKLCLGWCYDYLDGNRFADQRYLDSWPIRYPDVCVIGHKGANLAPWNLDAAPIEGSEGSVFVGGEPLIFYHFHGLKKDRQGGFRRNLERYLAEELLASPTIEAIYRPYERHLESLSAIAGETEGDPRHQENARPRPGPTGWEYRPQGWSEDAAEVPGWDLPSVLATFEDRLAIMQRRRGATVPVGGDLKMHNDLMAIGLAAARAALGLGAVRSLCMLDWGGALAMHREALRLLLPELRLDYHCRDLSRFAARGRDLMPDVSFHDNDSDAFSRRYDFVLFSASLQYVRDWRGLLRKAAGNTDGLMLISRLQIVESVPSFVVRQNVYSTDYRSAFQSWVINRTELLAAITESGLVLEREFLVDERPFVPGVPEHAEGRSFLLRTGTVSSCSPDVERRIDAASALQGFPMGRHDR